MMEAVVSQGAVRKMGTRIPLCPERMHVSGFQRSEMLDISSHCKAATWLGEVLKVDDAADLRAWLGHRVRECG